MPIYDFTCDDCQKDFEDIVIQSEMPDCPHCGGKNVNRKVSAPSPLKSRAFPFKLGPVHAGVKMAAQHGSACPKAGGCGSSSGGSGGFS